MFGQCPVYLVGRPGGLLELSLADGSRCTPMFGSAQAAARFGASRGVAGVVSVPDGRRFEGLLTTLLAAGIGRFTFDPDPQADVPSGDVAELLDQVRSHRCRSE